MKFADLTPTECILIIGAPCTAHPNSELNTGEIQAIMAWRGIPIEQRLNLIAHITRLQEKS